MTKIGFWFTEKHEKWTEIKNGNVGENGYNVHTIYKYSNEEKENKVKGRRKGKIWVFLKNRAEKITWVRFSNGEKDKKLREWKIKTWSKTVKSKI